MKASQPDRPQLKKNHSGLLGASCERWMIRFCVKNTHFTPRGAAIP
jgi:hypothetical protein